MKLHKLMTIGGVAIMANEEGTYVMFISDLDVCTDGTGPSHGDDYHLNTTAYNPYLNADKDRYIVIPPQLRSAVDPVVMGCQARVTQMETSAIHAAVVGEIGPDNKTGECAICLAKLLNPAVSANCGDSEKVYLYEFFPGIPAKVGNKTYKLQPA